MNLFDEMLENNFLKTATSVEKIFLYELRNITEQLKILNELKILELYSKFPSNTSECSKVLDRIDRIKEKLKERVQNG